MNKEMQAVIRNLSITNSGEPWYGRPVFSLLEEVDPAKAGKKPTETAHSMLELLYHMINWADFTLKRIEKATEPGIDYFEKMDWRQIDPSIHKWESGLAEFKNIHDKIIELLGQKTDEFLKEKVGHREYNFRFLLNGLIQHNIYHAGQIAYINKFLS